MARKSSFETEIRTVLVEVRADLKEHMRRTEALERFQAKWSGAFLAMTGVASLSGFAYTVVRLIEFLGR